MTISDGDDNNNNEEENSKYYEIVSSDELSYWITNYSNTP